MVDLDYRNYKIHIGPLVNNPTAKSDLGVIIRNDKFNLAFSFTRKCNKTITNYTEKSHRIFHVRRVSRTSTDYNIQETVEELVTESKVIVDMLCEMENRITEKVKKEVPSIKFSKLRGFYLERGGFND